jgi:hypothetical protein
MACPLFESKQGHDLLPLTDFNSAKTSGKKTFENNKHKK